MSSPALAAAKSWRRHAARMQRALITLLGLGSLDLALLDGWAAPALLRTTEVNAITATSTNTSTTTPAALPATRARPTLPAPLLPMLKPLPQLSAADWGGPSLRQADVYFTTGVWWIGPRGHKALADCLPRLQSNHHPILVIGYADGAGTREVNQRISDARARTVSAVLLESGIDAARIRARGRGEISSNESGRDRRAEVRLGETP
jgi:outer membrane protein OmpA-like peptidoglycan-associated protein